MKKKTKLALGGVVALFGALVLSGCTKSFCTNTDMARGMYAFEPGITRYESGDVTTEYDFEGSNYSIKNYKIEYATTDSADDIKYYFSDAEGKKEYLTTFNSVISNAKSAGIVPYTLNQEDFVKRMDFYAMKDILNAAANASESGKISRDLSVAEDLAAFKNDISYYSYLRYVENDSKAMYEIWNDRTALVKADIPSPDKWLSTDFINLYQSSLSNAVSSYRTCFTTVTGKYNTYTYKDGVYVTAKDWSYAWSKGFFEGLLVYPIGWLIDQIAVGFSGLGAGPAALLSIFFVTLIIRGLMMLLTIKQTAGNAKMTELQPEMTKIQNKYPNANTNKYEKQKMAEEMNALYKKNKINPLTTILVLIVQFPVFICVWGALSGASILTNGEILGLSLGMSIKDAMFGAEYWTAAGGYAGVTALILFILMAAAQTVSMLLPQWMQKARAKKVAKLGKNPAQKSQDNKMKWVTYIMLVMIIIMGFSLVSAMGVYWLIGALISLAQTLITQVITDKKAKKKRS